jgi:hypothetical protein
MVRAMIIIADSLLLRQKLDYDEGYDVALKGLSVVVRHPRRRCLQVSPSTTSLLSSTLH